MRVDVGSCVQVEPCEWRIRWDLKLYPVGFHMLLSAEEKNVNICVSVSLTPWLSRTIHCNFNGSLVCGHLRRVGEHCDGQSETLPYERKGEERGEEQREEKMK